MSVEHRPDVAIVDYGLGNLYSVQQACRHVGLAAEITADAAVIERARAVVIPGVGAFGDAMATLRRLDLVRVLQDAAASGRPFVGVCLGLQLLMTESEEFGRHEGLGLIAGTVRRIEANDERGRPVKVPQIGWNAVRKPVAAAGDPWAGTLLSDLADGDAMYFVHSYVVAPASDDDVLAWSSYGDFRFCSAVRRKNVTAFQFHPERSAAVGLQVYQRLAAQIQSELKENGRE
mgnify:CR=1 FL=1